MRWLQNSVCLLAAVAPVPRTVQRLAARVNGAGGKARVLHTTFTDPAEQAGIIVKQRADRDTEYGEVLERTSAFLAEIAARDAVQACRDAFTAFEAAALAADTGVAQAALETPQLRVLDNP